MHTFTLYFFHCNEDLRSMTHKWPELYTVATLYMLLVALAKNDNNKNVLKMLLQCIFSYILVHFTKKKKALK